MLRCKAKKLHETDQEWFFVIFGVVFSEVYPQLVNNTFYKNSGLK